MYIYIYISGTPERFSIWACLKTGYTTYNGYLDTRVVINQWIQGSPLFRQSYLGFAISKKPSQLVDDLQAVAQTATRNFWYLDHLICGGVKLGERDFFGHSFLALSNCLTATIVSDLDM